MFAILGLILALLAWFVHGAHVSMPSWFDYAALLALAVAAVAAQLFWPVWRGRRVPPAG